MAHFLKKKFKFWLNGQRVLSQTSKASVIGVPTEGKSILAKRRSKKE